MTEYFPKLFGTNGSEPSNQVIKTIFQVIRTNPELIFDLFTVEKRAKPTNKSLILVTTFFEF